MTQINQEKLKIRSFNQTSEESEEDTQTDHHLVYLVDPGQAPVGRVHSVHGGDEGGGLPPVAVLLRVLLEVALRVVAVLLLGDDALGVHAELLQRALKLVILLPQLPETRWTNQKPVERSLDLCRPIRGQ